MDKPITKEILEAYITTLEKQVQQMALVARTLEELNEKVETGDNEITERIGDVANNINAAITTISLINLQVELILKTDKELGEKAYELTNEIKDKIGGIREDISELQSAIKADRITNVVGLGTFILGMLTIILKVFGIFGKI